MNYFRFSFTWLHWSPQTSMCRLKNQICIFGMYLFFPVSLSKEYAVLFIVLLPLFYVFILDVPVRRSLLLSLPTMWWPECMCCWGSASRVTDLGKKATDEVLNNQYILGTWSEKIRYKSLPARQIFCDAVLSISTFVWLFIQSDSFYTNEQHALHRIGDSSRCITWVACLFISSEEKIATFSCCFTSPTYFLFPILPLKSVPLSVNVWAIYFLLLFVCWLPWELYTDWRMWKIWRKPNNWRCCVVWDWLCWWVPFRLLQEMRNGKMTLLYLHTM